MPAFDRVASRRRLCQPAALCATPVWYVSPPLLLASNRVFGPGVLVLCRISGRGWVYASVFAVSPCGV